MCKWNPLTEHETGGKEGLGHARRVFAGVSLAYLFLTFLLTYPLVFRLGSHLCGDVGDNYAFLWQFRWFSIALTELHVSPFHTPFLNYPEGASLLLNPTTLFNTGLSIPLQRLFSVTATYNLLVLGSFWMSAVAMYLLMSSLTSSRFSSFVAGFVYAFSSYHFAHALGHLTTLSIEWIPLFVLFLIKALHTHRRKHRVLASLFFVLSALCSWHFLFCCGLLLCWTVFFFSFPWRRERSLRVISDGAGILGLTLLVLAPLLVPMMIEAAKRTSLVGHAPAHYPADLAGFFIPNFTSTFSFFFAPLWSQFRANPIESSTFIGISVLALAFWAIWKLPRRTTSYWVYTLAVFFTLSLGPRLNFLGRVLPIPLPYALIHHAIPFASVAGVPARFHVVSTLCLAVLSGFGVRILFGQLKAHRSGRAGRTLLGCVTAGLFLLMVAEHLHVPVFLTRHTVSPFYESLAKDPRDYAVVDFTERGKALFCQSVHRKSLVGGYVARGSEDRHGFLKESEIVPSVQAIVRSAPGGDPNQEGLGASRIFQAHNIRFLIFPRPADPSPLRDLLGSYLSHPPPDAGETCGSPRAGSDPGESVSGTLLRSARSILQSEGPPALAAFALKVRFLFASHPELLPSNGIASFVRDSERIVARVWGFPVTYEDDQIRVYSVDRRSRDKEEPEGK